MTDKSKQNSRQDNKDNDYETQVVNLNRCATVVKGGRIFSFSALCVAGKKGMVGWGFAKAAGVSEALAKANAKAIKNVRPVQQTEDGSLPHGADLKVDGTRIILKPAPIGTGIKAGSVIRKILKLAGYENVVAKLLGSSNSVNQVRAVFNALEGMRTKEQFNNLRNNTNNN
jgi:small subunit ribosomal protein S5